MAPSGRRSTINSPPVNNFTNNNNNNNGAATGGGGGLLPPSQSPNNAGPGARQGNPNQIAGRSPSASLQPPQRSSASPNQQQARASPSIHPSSPAPVKSPSSSSESAAGGKAAAASNGTSGGKTATPRVYGSISQGTPRFGPHATNGVTAYPSLSPNPGPATATGRTSQLNVDFVAALQQVQSSTGGAGGGSGASNSTGGGACKGGCGCNTPPPACQQSSASRSPTTPNPPLPSPSTTQSSQGQRSPMHSPNGSQSGGSQSGSSSAALPLSKRLLLRHKTNESEQNADATGTAPAPTLNVAVKQEPQSQASPSKPERSVKFQVPEVRDSALRATLGRPTGGAGASSQVLPVSGASAVSAALGDLSEILGMPFRERVFTDTEIMRKRPAFARPGLRTLSSRSHALCTR